MRTSTNRCLAALAALLLPTIIVSFPVGVHASNANGGSRWGANYFPNVELTNQHGDKVRFFDDLIKDKVVAINFIFTSCKSACPAETAKMRQVQKTLGDRVGKDIFFYSISIDPEHDTPEVLAAYAKKFDAGPGWMFLTGKEEDVVLLRKKLGLFIAEIADDPEDHNISLIVGNQAIGRWMKRSPFDNSQVLAEVLGGFLHNYKVRDARAANQRDYSAAPATPTFTRGHYLFRTRCTSCHTIGGGDGVGPDLLGVTEKRDPDWLLRWIKTPDQMLEEGDPIAVELYKQYQELAMPNLQLNDKDAGALIEYMESTSRAFQSRGDDGRMGKKAVDPIGSGRAAKPQRTRTAATTTAQPAAHSD